MPIGMPAAPASSCGTCSSPNGREMNGPSKSVHIDWRRMDVSSLQAFTWIGGSPQSPWIQSAGKTPGTGASARHAGRQAPASASSPAACAPSDSKKRRALLVVADHGMPARSNSRCNAGPQSPTSAASTSTSTS